jgi:hypothetical protein
VISSWRDITLYRRNNIILGRKHTIKFKTELKYHEPITFINSHLRQDRSVTRLKCELNNHVRNSVLNFHSVFSALVSLCLCNKSIDSPSVISYLYCISATFSLFSFSPLVWLYDLYCVLFFSIDYMINIGQAHHIKDDGNFECRNNNVFGYLLFCVEINEKLRLSCNKVCLPIESNSKSVDPYTYRYSALVGFFMMHVLPAFCFSFISFVCAGLPLCCYIRFCLRSNKYYIISFLNRAQTVTIYIKHLLKYPSIKENER